MHRKSNQLHTDLAVAEKLAYSPSGLTISNIVEEVEGAEYGACTFDLDNWHIKFRVAKRTPKKIGYFVTLWKRVGDGPTLPHDVEDSFDFFIISVRTVHHFGQFIFPKAVLLAQGVISYNGKGGKRGMRVYAPWDKPDSLIAQKTQAWQHPYFSEITPDTSFHKMLFSKFYEK